MRNIMINTEARFSQSSIRLRNPSIVRKRRDLFQTGAWSWSLTTLTSLFMQFFTSTLYHAICPSRKTLGEWGIPPAGIKTLKANELLSFFQVIVENLPSG
jgi:hypothetical protein